MIIKNIPIADLHYNFPLGKIQERKYHITNHLSVESQSMRLRANGEHLLDLRYLITTHESLVHRFTHPNSGPSFKNSDGGISPRTIDHNNDMRRNKQWRPQHGDMMALAHFLNLF
jgi:hypothetical protein